MRLTLAVGAALGALLVAGCGGAQESAAERRAAAESRPGTSATPSPGVTLSPSVPAASGTTTKPTKPAKPQGTATTVPVRTGAAARVPRRVIMQQLRNRAERLARTLPSESPETRPADVDPDSNRGLGHQMLLEFGFAAEQWPYLDALWRRESAWNHLAENPSSGAYGIPQSLPATKMAVVGEDWRTNPETQIMWGLAYIAARYGSPEKAWAHSQRFNWY